LATEKVKAGPNRAMPSKMAPPPMKMGLAKKVGILKITRLKAKHTMRYVKNRVGSCEAYWGI
jgi:hypothetical protein